MGRFAPSTWYLGRFAQPSLIRLTAQNVIFDILEPSAFQKHCLCLRLCLNMDSGCNEPNVMSANMYRLFIVFVFVFIIHIEVEDIVLFSALFHMRGLA